MNYYASFIQNLGCVIFCGILEDKIINLYVYATAYRYFRNTVVIYPHRTI